MFLNDFLFALLIALLLTVIFAGGLRGHGFGAALIFFFVVLLFGTWAGGVWITPIGTPVWGVSWLSFVLVGLFFALVLTALLPPHPNRMKRVRPSEEEEDATPVVVFGVFFWIFIGGLIAAIITHYLTW
ncbi:MAG: hypothetical protein P8165_07240 [Deltaproteobacteria bacterium]|jgi:O-antigen ligase